MEDVERGLASPLGGRVHDVVVDQRERLEEFDRRSGRQRDPGPGPLFLSAAGEPAPPDQGRPDPFAAQGEGGDAGGQFTTALGVEGSDLTRPFHQIPVQGLADGLSNVLDAREQGTPGHKGSPSRRWW